MKPEEAYSYRSFEHHKRESFPIIAKIMAQLRGEITLMDLGCGPAVLEGIAQAVTGGRIREAWLLDREPGFCEYAKCHLQDVIPRIQTRIFDMNDPSSLPDDAPPLSAVVSVNALFHATAANLEAIYTYCFHRLSPGGILVNHQTFGGAHVELIDRYCGSLDPKTIQDHLDAELGRRSHRDAESAREPVGSEGGGGYAGLSLGVDEHLAMLEEIGFDATEIWRKGKSAVVMAEKPADPGAERPGGN